MKLMPCGKEHEAYITFGYLFDITDFWGSVTDENQQTVLVTDDGLRVIVKITIDLNCGYVL